MKKILLIILIVSMMLNMPIVLTTYAEETQKEYRIDILLPGKYENLHSDGQYIYAQTQDNTLTIFNRNMEILLETQYKYDPNYEFTDGLICIEKDGLYGAINIDGNVVIDFLYTTLSKFNAGKSTAVRDDKTFILDKMGNVCAQYGYASAFVNGYAFVSDKQFYGSGGRGDYIILTRTLGEVGDPNYPKTSAERSGFRLINADCNVVFDNLEADIHTESGVQGYKPGWGQTVYYSPTLFNEQGVAVAKRNGKYGLINTKGEVIYDFTLDSHGTRGTYIVGREGSDTIIAFENNGVRYYGELPPSAPPSSCTDPLGISSLPKSILQRYLSNKDGYTYIDKNKHTIYYTQSGKTYDQAGNLIFEYPVNAVSLFSISSYNIYIFTSEADRYNNRNYGIMSVNEVPHPKITVGDKYICLMQDNPLLNISGHISQLEKDNYFFVPMVESDRTLVPLRTIFEAMQATVDWDDTTKTVTAVKDGIKIRIGIDKREMYKNNDMIWLDTPPRLVDDRTLVPLRAISEAFGAIVDWDEESKTITILY